MLKQIRIALSNPELVAMEALKFIHHLQNKRATLVMDTDWDVIIILDGCRYDLFKKVNSMAGSLNSIISPASCTRKWLNKNFPKEYQDTVLVSANPQTQIHNIEEKFHHCERLYESCWNDSLRTVPPSPAIDQVIEVAKEFPQKRLIVHLVQPHFPFIGNTGREIQQRGFTEEDRHGKKSDNNNTQHEHIWQRLEQGELDKKIVWKAYRENLELALTEVNRLLANIDGKPVLTSDHGNALGSWRTYGHPCGRYHPSLVIVPWFEPEFDSRRTITENELDQKLDTTAKITERLEDLGYISN